jgi:mannose-6-phosphate isomerase-like protein (cupin superfamily)
MCRAAARPSVVVMSEHDTREERRMIRAGDSIENPVTGERLVFKKTAAETDGEYVLFECVVEPSGFVAAAHVHPFQEERFEILEGAVTFKLDGQELPTGPGDRILVPAGRKHQFWNAGETEARFECEVRPALEFERLVETMFALARDGKTNRKGMPNPLRLAVIARAHFDTVRLPFPPAWLQRFGLVLGAPLGWILGYRATYTSTDERVGREVVPA